MAIGIDIDENMSNIQSFVSASFDEFSKDIHYTRKLGIVYRTYFIKFNGMEKQSSKLSRN